MVELIRTKKGIDYPADFIVRVRAFNNALVSSKAGFVSDLMNAFPGMRLTKFEASEVSEPEQALFDTLCAERDRFHAPALMAA